MIEGTVEDGYEDEQHDMRHSLMGRRGSKRHTSERAKRIVPTCYQWSQCNGG